MTRRTKLTLAFGLVAFLIGAVGVFRSVTGGDRTAARPDRVTAVFAASEIPSGTTGAEAASKGLVQVRPVPRAARPAGALTDTNDLAGRVAADDIPAGRVITDDLFAPAQSRIGTLRIPPGKTALAVQMANVPGVAGFVGAGDRIAVYAVVKEGSEADRESRGVHLIMQGIEVINVNGAALAPVQGQPDGEALVFLLAVAPAEAERLVYLTTFEQLYFSLVPKDQTTAPSTPGSGPADALRRT